MEAKVGDHIVIKGHHISQPERGCEVLEVHGVNGAPPYLVRWGDNGHEAVFVPGSDASVMQNQGVTSRKDS
jgi:hypothetical protein